MHPRRIVRDLLGTALAQYVARAALLARGVVAAAALGPGGFGAWNALSLLLDYGAYAPAGAILGLERELPAAAARGDQARARSIMSGAWAIGVSGVLLFTLAVLVYLATGTRRIAWTWGWGAPALMLVAVAFQLAIQYHASALRAHGEFQRVSAALAIQAVLGGGVGLVLVATQGVWGLLGGWLAGSLAAFLWLRAGTTRPPLLPGAMSDGLGLVQLGLPMFAYFLLSLILRSVDRIALAHYAGSAGLGLYTLGLMAAGLILYLPEAAATVLFPRMTAAAQGARDPERTRIEIVRVQRAIAVALPPLVGLAMVWAGPVVGWLLPAFQDGVPALRVLAVGALLLSAGTLPGYFLLAQGRRRALVTMTAAVALATAALVFSVAARDHRPVAIAMASAAGYAGLALGLVLLAAPGLCAQAGERAVLLVSSFVPAAWAGGAALAACAFGGGETVRDAVLRSLAVVLACLPVVWAFGRGVGLRRLAREWRAGKPVPV